MTRPDKAEAGAPAILAPRDWLTTWRLAATNHRQRFERLVGLDRLKALMARLRDDLARFASFREQRDEAIASGDTDTAELMESGLTALDSRITDTAEEAKALMKEIK